MKPSLNLLFEIANLILGFCWLGFIGYSFLVSSNHTGIKILPFAYCLLAIGITLSMLVMFEIINHAQIVTTIFLCIGFGCTLLAFHHLHLMMYYEDWLKAGMPEKGNLELLFIDHYWF